MSDRRIAAAAAALQRGGLVAFPTETVYGLGADAESPDAVSRIFAAKGRPAWHPLIVHGADAGLLERYAERPGSAAQALAEAFWPGPLTLVVPRSTRVPDVVSGGQGTVGLRVPDHPVALALLAAFGRGVAAPSANRFGRVSPTSAADVRAELGDAVDLVLDGGACTLGIESTVLDLASEAPTILRPGGVPADALQDVLGQPVRRGRGLGGPRAPGTLETHYAPLARIELHSARSAAARARQLADAGVRFGIVSPGPVSAPGAVAAFTDLGGAPDYARALYRALRACDEAGADIVLAVTPGRDGLSEAITDRLERAAGTS